MSKHTFESAYLNAEQLRQSMAADVQRSIIDVGGAIVEDFYQIDNRLPLALREAMSLAQRTFAVAVASSDGAGSSLDVADAIWPGYVDRNYQRVAISTRLNHESACLLSSKMLNRARSFLDSERIRFAERAFSNLLQLGLPAGARSIASTNLWIGDAEIASTTQQASRQLLGLIVQKSGESWKIDEEQGVVVVGVPGRAFGRPGVAKEISRRLAKLGVRNRRSGNVSASWPWRAANVSEDFAFAAYDAWLAALFCAGRDLAPRMASLIQRLLRLLAMPEPGLSLSEQTLFRAQAIALQSCLDAGCESQGESLAAASLSRPLSRWSVFNLDSHETAGADELTIGSMMFLDFNGPVSLPDAKVESSLVLIIFRSAILCVRTWEQRANDKLRRTFEDRIRHAHSHGSKRISQDLGSKQWPLQELFEESPMPDSSLGSGLWKLKRKHQHLDCSNWLVEPAGVSLLLPAAIQLMLDTPTRGGILESNLARVSKSALLMAARMNVGKSPALSDNANLLALVWGVGAFRGMLQRVRTEESTMLDHDIESRVLVVDRISHDAAEAVESVQFAMRDCSAFGVAREEKLENDFLRDCLRRILGAAFEVASNTFRHIPTAQHGRSFQRSLPEIQISERAGEAILAIKNRCENEPSDLLGTSTVNHVAGLLHRDGGKRLGSCEIVFSPELREVITNLSFSLREVFAR